MSDYSRFSMPPLADDDFDEWTEDEVKLRRLGFAGRIFRKATQELKSEMPAEKRAVVAQTASTAGITAKALLFGWVPPLSQVELRS